MWSCIVEKEYGGAPWRTGGDEGTDDCGTVNVSRSMQVGFRSLLAQAVETVRLKEGCCESGC